MILLLNPVNAYLLRLQRHDYHLLSAAKQDTKPRIHTNTSRNFLNNSRALLSETKGLRQITPENQPESAIEPEDPPKSFDKIIVT